MPNPDYSYQGWNPGQGMSDFASTMRQGYLDQQSLRERQYENLLQGEKTESDLQHPLNGDAIVPENYLDTTSVAQGEQQAANVATANRRGAYVVNPQTNSVQEIGANNGGGAQAASAPQARSMNQTAPQGAPAQNGGPNQPPPAPIDPSKFDKDEQGNLVDGQGNQIDNHVVLAAQRLGGHVDPDTGAVHVPGYMAKVLGQQFDKNQSALAAIGTAAFRGGLVNAPQVHMVAPPRAAPVGGAKDPIDAAYKADPVLQGYYRVLSSNAAMTLTPDQRNNYFNLIQQRQQQIQQHFGASPGGGQPAPAPRTPPPAAPPPGGGQGGGHSPQSIQNAIQKYMQAYPHATPQQAQQAAQKALGL